MRYFLLVCLSIFGCALSAQTSTTFTMPDVGANNNTEVCLPVTSINFTGGIEFSMAIRVDPTGALTFTRVTNLNTSIPGFSQTDFDLTTYVNDGIITVQYQNWGPGQTCADAGPAITLPDNETIFEVCYNVSGGLATQHLVEFYDLPDPTPFDGVDDAVEVVFNKRANCNQNNDAFPGRESGSVTVDVDPLILDVSEPVGIIQPGDVFCVDVIAVDGFDNLTGYQFGLQFDSTVIRAQSATANPALAQNVSGNYNTFNGQTFYAVWTPFNTVQSLPENTPLVNVCFEVVGNCTDRTDITVGPIPTSSGGQRPVEANPDMMGVSDIPVVQRGTRLIVDDCNPNGFDLEVRCPTGVTAGDTDVCVEFVAGDDFVDMTDLDFQISWNTDILEYDNIGFRNPDLFSSLTQHWDYAQVNQGRLFFDWDSPGSLQVTIPAGEVLFEVCYDAINFGGTSPISMSDFRNDIVSGSNGAFDGINPMNCAVDVAQPPGVAVYFPNDIGFSSSDPDCFELTVDGFTDVTSFTLNISTSPVLFELFSFTPAIPGVTSVELATGFVEVRYSGPPLNLADGTSLGTMCYRAQDSANPGDCDRIGLATFAPSSVVTSTSNGFSVPVNSIDGNSCVLFPRGFRFDVKDATTDIGTSFCVPVTVENFVGIRTVDVRFFFDPALVTFDNVNISGTNWPGLSQADFDLSQVATGIIGLSYDSGGAGVSYSGGVAETQVFQFCFQAGTADGCFDLEGEDAAFPATTTDDGDGSVLYNDGEVCLEDRIIVNNVTVVNATCADADDGMILFDVEPRPNNEDVIIRTDNPVRFGTNGEVRNLRTGVTNYVLYNPNGTVQTSGTVMIGVDSSNLAVANAGMDRTIECAGTGTALVSGRDNEGETWQLFLINPANGQLRQVRSGDIGANGNYVAIVNDPGEYVLEVTSLAGCSALDTVMVTADDAPDARAGDDVTLTCDQGLATLSAGGSSTGANVSYLWESITNQGMVIDTVSTDFDFTTSTPGRYRLIVTFTDVDCSSSDVVDVIDETFPPSSSLASEIALNCDGSPVTLTPGNPQDNVVYDWRNDAGMTVSTNRTFATDQVGTYEVTLRDTVTGCVTTDMVDVVMSPGVPTVTYEGQTTVNCSPDTTEIRPIYGNVNPTTTYLWETPDGLMVGTTVSSPAVLALSPGTYTVTVDNDGCEATQTITLSEAIFPDVSAGPDATINCGETFELTGIAAIMGGGTLQYFWTRDAQPINTSSTRTVVVDQPGEYVLTVNSAETGCAATDTVLLLPPDGFPEYELADTITGLGCDGDVVEMRVTGDDALRYEYRWTFEDDPTVVGNIFRLSARMAGVYNVEITNPATGCVSNDRVVVISDAADPPFIAISQNGTQLTCENPLIRIDATASAVSDNIAFGWSTVIGNVDVSDETSGVLEVQEPGTFRLTLTNTETNCTNTRDISIGDGRNDPEVEAQEFIPLDCELRSSVIGVNVLTQTDEVTVNWSGPGSNDFPRDTNRIAVIRGGTYSAIAINDQTSCVTIVTFSVPDFQDSIATIRVQQPDQFSCENSTVTIDASETELNLANLDGVSWRAIDGAGVISPATGSLTVEVDAPGDYEISVADPSGCVLLDTVSVAAANDTPVARAVTDVETDCDASAQLDASASTPAPSDSITYVWTPLDGGMIVSGGDTPLPFIEGIGRYQLVVTNTVKECRDTVEVTVRINDIDRAELGEDIFSCNASETVMGNLPEGSTGAWTEIGADGATIQTEGAVASVTNIGDGLQLIWTLSAPGCPAYSADTIAILPEVSPEATDDRLEVGGQDPVGTIDVLANDVRQGPVTVTLLNEPFFGEVTANLNGTITYEAPRGFSGTTTIDYEICSQTCDGLCDVGTLTVVAESEGVDPDVYNAFTPNGDGVNETFVFELLAQRPADYPNNELVVFNRWGDIIYQAAPYNNDWDGTTDGGTPVGEGTYYYILRLNIGEGEIIRGDVTVVR